MTPTRCLLESELTLHWMLTPVCLAADSSCGVDAELLAHLFSGQCKRTPYSFLCVDVRIMACILVLAPGST